MHVQMIGKLCVSRFLRGPIKFPIALGAFDFEHTLRVCVGNLFNSLVPCCHSGFAISIIALTSCIVIFLNPGSQILRGFCIAI